MDTFTPDQRSELMRRVRGQDTEPEMMVRRFVHRMGFRYRLHCRELPGNPDLVFPSRRKIIFVHGCFWHGHACRSGRNRPSSNQMYWIPKLERNRKRDRANRRKLKKLGWDVLVVWECQLKHGEEAAARIARFLT
jgi:DNA mismatch endonuclease (patch repair protein)